MATIEEMEKKITIFYEKESGNVILVTQGIQDLHMFRNSNKYNFEVLDFDEKYFNIKNIAEIKEVK